MEFQLVIQSHDVDHEDQEARVQDAGPMIRLIRFLCVVHPEYSRFLYIILPYIVPNLDLQCS